jgi:hypothetical protein|tara:strand:+ start:29375 stop:30436 length:1062 start_codon:yes stop_codon:yes gene_type:complete
VAIPTVGLKAYWNFETIVGNTVTDEVGSFNGTKTNADQVPGWFNNGIRFYSVPNSKMETNAGPSDDISMSLFFKRDGLPSAIEVLWSQQQTSVPNSASYRGMLFINDRVQFFARNNTGAGVSIGTPEGSLIDYCDDKFHHACLIEDDDGFRAYIDGELIGFQDGYVRGTYNNNLRLSGRISLNDLPFDGILDEVRLYEVGLSTAQVLALLDEFTYTQINGVIDENLAAENWKIHCHHAITGELTSLISTTETSFNIQVPPSRRGPQILTVLPDYGDQWLPDNDYVLGEFCFPNDPSTTPYYYRCIVAGTSDETEPLWPSSPAGATLIDGDVQWELVERMVQPITHGPLIPTAI